VPLKDLPSNFPSVSSIDPATALHAASQPHWFLWAAIELQFAQAATQPLRTGGGGATRRV